MKKSLFISIILITLNSCNSKSSNSSHSVNNSDKLNKKHASTKNNDVEIVPYTNEGLNKFLNEIKNNEPSAKSIYFDKKKGFLYIASNDDGTLRNGLAEYYCQLGKDYDVKLSSVQIVDFNFRNINPKVDKVIGECICND